MILMLFNAFNESSLVKMFILKFKFINNIFHRDFLFFMEHLIEYILIVFQILPILDVKQTI